MKDGIDLDRLFAAMQLIVRANVQWSRFEVARAFRAHVERTPAFQGDPRTALVLGALERAGYLEPQRKILPS